jgi:hypothetical protein
MLGLDPLGAGAVGHELEVAIRGQALLASAHVDDDLTGQVTEVACDLGNHLARHGQDDDLRLCGCLTLIDGRGFRPGAGHQGADRFAGRFAAAVNHRIPTSADCRA